MGQEKKYFGTDGIRGVAGVPPFDPETLVRLGKAIAKIFQVQGGKHRILIGKDTRLSGYMIETALTAGITSMGVDVKLVGPLPTPGVAYLTRSTRVDAGIMISASHNPFEDNGIKIFAGDGYKLPDEMEYRLEEILESESLAKEGVEPGLLGKAQRIDDAPGRYTVCLKSCFPRELSFEGLKVGFDAANGAGYHVGPMVLQEMGAEVISRGTSPSGKNINAGFGSLYPEVVAKLVVEQGLDVGIALDGDADRCIMCDEKGEIYDGDMTLALCAVDLKERGLLRGHQVVATVMSNLGLEKYLAAHDITVERAQVGDRYVLEEMLRLGCDLGGEQSGHTIFSAHSTTGDGIFTAMNILAIMARKGKKLSELMKNYVRFPQKLVNIPVSAKPPLDSIESLQSMLKTKQKELGTKGRILVRYSGTESKVRVMVEAEDEELCKKHCGDLVELLEREIGQ